MRNYLAIYIIAVVIIMLLYFDTGSHIGKKDKNQLDLINSKITFFKVVLELVILLLCKTVI